MNDFVSYGFLLGEVCFPWFPFQVAKEYLRNDADFNQLPDGCNWDGGAMTICETMGSELWSAIWVRTDVATASALEVELTPLEVLTELCWIASVWGLLGTEMSSELSSLSVAEKREEGKSMAIPL